MLLGLGLGVMRGERERPPLRVAYWVVMAIYMIATLGHVLAAGNEMAVTAAISFPVGLVVFPCFPAVTPQQAQPPLICEWRCVPYTAHLVHSAAERG